jgi:hypothetical protein
VSFFSFPFLIIISWFSIWIFIIQQWLKSSTPMSGKHLFFKFSCGIGYFGNHYFKHANNGQFLTSSFVLTWKSFSCIHHLVTVVPLHIILWNGCNNLLHFHVSIVSFFSKRLWLIFDCVHH